MSASLPPTSRSGSHSRSHSLSTTGIVETSGVEEVSTRKPFTQWESGLVSFLDIPAHLTRQYPGNTLSDNFTRYLVVVAALAKQKQTKSWPERPPTQKEVIELVIGKSQWGGTWLPNFKRAVTHFPKMVKFLEGDPTVDAEELWGIPGEYRFTQLTAWMNGGGKPLKGKDKEVTEKAAESSSKVSPDKKSKKKKKKQQVEA